MLTFTGWKSTDNNSHDELPSIDKIKLISLLDFLKEHNIRPGDFLSTDKKLKEFYTLCNIKTLQHVWDLKDAAVLQQWNGTIISLGTAISLKVCESLQVECYPALRLKMFKQQDRRSLVTLQDISRYELIGRNNIKIAVF